VKSSQYHILAALFFLIIGCSEEEIDTSNNSPNVSLQPEITVFEDFTLVKEYPHDPTAFTQGLVMYQDRLFEGTGRESWVAEVDIATGYHNKKLMLPDPLFGEGITILDNKLYQLTWKNKVGFVYDLDTFQKIEEFHYDHEGWGITTDGTNLIVSDGTDKLYFYSPTPFRLLEVRPVTFKGEPVKYINELEYLQGLIYANQWKSDVILKIDPKTAEVVTILDLSPLADKIYAEYPGADSMNGIAYDQFDSAFLMTGKLWPKLFKVRF